MKLTELFSEEAILSAPMQEMANLPSADTGLSVVLWFGEVGGQHGPRIKASNIKGKFSATDNFVLTVSTTPQVLTPRSAKLQIDEIDDIKDWIILNYETLMKLWYAFENDQSTLELLNSLQKI